MLRKIIFFSILVSIAFSCGKLKGEFAFKTFYDDSYKKFTIDPEFAANEEVKWVYVFKSASKSPQKIGIIYMKKEVVWVDIWSNVSNITANNKLI